MSQSLSKVLGALTTQKDGHSSSRSPLGIMDHQVLCPPATDLEAVEACEKYLETLVTKLTDPEVSLLYEISRHCRVQITVSKEG